MRAVRSAVLKIHCFNKSQLLASHDASGSLYTLIVIPVRTARV
jgi:hypothetical protein